MTQDEIIEMAKQAGYSVDTFGFGIWDSTEFNRFAKLVAQRTWVGLTDADRLELAAAQHGWEDLLIAAETKLKEKNA